MIIVPLSWWFIVFDPSFLCHPGNAQKPARGYAENGCQFEALPPSPTRKRARRVGPRNPRDAWAQPKYRSYFRQARALPLFYCVKFYQRLRPDHGNQMTQFVFDVAGHGDRVSNLLS